MKQVLLGLSTAVLLVLVLAVSAALYLVHHPEHIKPVVTRGVSQALGMDLGIHRLTWGRDPLRLVLEGVTVVSRDSSRGALHLAVQDLRAEMSLEGGFGRRTLIVDRATARGVDLLLRGRPPLSLEEREAPGTASWPARAAGGLLRWLLFRDVRLERASLEKAQATLHLKGTVLRVHSLGAELTPERRVNTAFGLRLSRPESRLFVDLPRIEVEAGPQDDPGRIEARIDVPDGVLGQGDRTARGLSVHGDLAIDADRKRVHIETLDLHVPDLGPWVPAGLETAPSARLKGSGVVLWNRRSLEQVVFRVTLRERDARLKVHGNAKGSWQGPPQGSVHGLMCRFRPSDWMALLPPAYRPPMGLQMAGTVLVTGGAEARLDPDGFHAAPDLTLELENNAFSLSSPPVQANARLEGRIRIHGPWPEPSIAGRLRGVQMTWEHPAARILPSEADLRLGGRLQEVHLAEATLDTPVLRIPRQDEALEIEDLHVEVVGGRLNPFSSRIRLPEIRLTARDLGPVLLSATYQEGGLFASAEGEDTGILAWLSRPGRPLQGWGMSGTDHLRARLDSEPSGAWIGSVRAGVTGFAFERPSIEAFGEGLALSLDARLRIGAEGDLVLDSSTATVSSGEALVDRFYLNLGNHPLTFRASTRGNLDPVELCETALEAELEGVLRVRASGSLAAVESGTRADVEVSVPSFPLGPAFRLFVVDPFRMEVPALKQASLEGRGSADLRLRTEPGGFLVDGHVRVQGGGLRSEAPAASVEDLSLSLPLRYGTLPMERETPGRGTLSIESLEVPFLPRQPLRLDLESGPNRIRIPDATEVRIPGGSLRLGPLDLDYPVGGGLRMASSLHLADVSLRPLLERFWPGTPEGRIRGRLSPLRLEDGRLTSQGSLQAEVFSGRVTVENLGAIGLFTASPAYRAGARWEGLDLEQMTRGTAFGLITGVLKGRVHRFELAYGQPQRFDLLTESVPTEGVEQRISVKAVDNIAQIGGGTSPFVGLAGLLTSFFKEFPYEKIGVHAVLENDIFRINGTIHEGGKEYLIKRSGISGVNIVNQNPDNRIRFKDMVKRIQRVTSSHGGPVIR